ncbi:hypothetical protein CN680_12155 [Bacillus pseudomycoides]|uniref:ABC-three component system protein n=1 Tax=Bacillus pseudomycoides TaxID=64104 RepID=UPI000BEC7E1F|nr:ABC-three component system protein [Bacillus pseudomycoides]PED69143.1 hypothetical protein CON97_26900 [Bacillus pseudomycoides]PEI45555.1 hypothetical protein CN620_02270 [Bacillus pseudomycoides]PEJ78671.1 hypothetical protein CN680_12155 [Bacillus pseudomycoides]PEM16398.1 hypothetical protein CN628_13875 [Bacillus pseudomycoides]PEO96753.1 hypothetical protein CN550_17820 [Bacillus pseudomycoides]
MLSTEKTISENFDIAYFNYFTEIIDVNRTKSVGGLLFGKIFKKTINVKKNIGIKQLSEFLKSSIEVYCSDYENIILIAHSMGGLVSKAYILKDLEEQLKTKVKLFLSLAVPHNGSNWALIGNALLKKNPQILDLTPLSSFLNTINNNWIQQKDTVPRTIYFYGQFDNVVDEASAIAYQVTRQHKVACNNDHFSISKPDSTSSIVYCGVKQKLEEFLKEVQYGEDMRPKKYKDDGELDDELFVLKLLIADVHNRLVLDAKQYFFTAEYMKKAVISAGYSQNDLMELYENIETLYKINFWKITEGDENSSNRLITEIHEQILEKSKDFLKTSIPLINVNKKLGMLHQMANDYDKQIWWAREHSIKDIDEFRRARDANE